jgi:hypothetical protein
MERLAEVKGNWGTLRAVTSGSYAASSLLSGVAVVAGGVLLIGPLYTIGSLIVLAGTIGLRITHRPRSAATEEELEAERSELAGGNAEIAVAGNWRDRFGTVSLAFAQSPRLLPFLLLSLLMNLGAGLFYAYGSLRIQEVGGDASAVTLAATISASVEIPFFLIGGAVAMRFGMRAVYSVGLIALGLCSLGYAFDVSPLFLGIILDDSGHRAARAAGNRTGALPGGFVWPGCFDRLDRWWSALRRTRRATPLRTVWGNSHWFGAVCLEDSARQRR